MAYIRFDGDWDPSTSLAEQARRLVTDRLSRGVTLGELLDDQRACLRGSPTKTMLWLFHMFIIREIKNRFDAARPE
ncbi:hypothetical protein B0H65DRAFT_451197 [Neurospora tetraspora]|uniref:Uncharacterized protein n=1 Tax=Neurospora tetraspora TaxID=94610 RepID=A0AAE0JP85_9PEZI|nr:hypothetical protein B0H65DRAFT_451197 [Neurospora tetraspora]